MPTVCETYSAAKGIHHMEKGRVVICAAGTGLPFFTTDTGAALRAAELKCNALLKGTSVDGIYSADPKKDPTAQRYDRLTYGDVLARDLKVMDGAAIAAEAGASGGCAVAAGVGVGSEGVSAGGGGVCRAARARGCLGDVVGVDVGVGVGVGAAPGLAVTSRRGTSADVGELSAGGESLAMSSVCGSVLAVPLEKLGMGCSKNKVKGW